MDHEHFEEQLSEWVAGTLDTDQAASFQAHLDGCAECQHVADAMQTLASVGMSRGETLLDPHPPSDWIVQFAQRDPALDSTSLAQIAAHVRACPRCALECDLAEASLQDRVAWTERVFGWLRNPVTGSLSMGRLATTALILFMAVPTYRGLTHSNSLEAGAGSPLLYLPAAQRGTLPTPELGAPGSDGVTPLVLQYDLALQDRLDAELQLELRRDSVRVWTLDTTSAKVWNPTLSTVSFLVPNAKLAPGNYTLELRVVGESAPLTSSRFRVLDGLISASNPDRE